MPTPKLPKIPTRSYGTGSIRYLESRRGYFARMPEGKDKQRDSKLFKLADYRSPVLALQAAEDWLNEMVLKRRRKQEGSSSLTVAEWIEEYLGEPGWKIKTRYERRKILNRFVIPHLGRMRLSELQPLDVERWIKPLKCTPDQRWRSLHNLKLVLEKARKLRMIPYNPAADIAVPKPKKAELVVWEPDEVIKALTYLETTHPMFYRYVYINLTTGLRREEMLGLTWPRVHLDTPDPYLYIKEVVTFTAGAWHFELEPKTRGSERIVYIDGETAKLLEQQRAYVIDLQATAREWQDMGLVFPRDTGVPLSDRTLSDWFKRLATGAGVTHIPAKNLRHTNATLTDRTQQVPLEVAAQRSGHSASVRQAHYQGRQKSAHQAAALPMATLVGSGYEQDTKEKSPAIKTEDSGGGRGI
jgi:integrase